MAKRIVRLTESQMEGLVNRMVKKIIKEGEAYAHHDLTGWIGQDDRPVPQDYMDIEGSDFEEQRKFGPGEYEDFMEFINNCDNKWCIKTKEFYDRYSKKGPISVRKM